MPQNGNQYSLYFHVPFCTRKCDYCHFYVIPDQKRYKDLYMHALRKEWKLRFSLLPQHGELVSIYFGGGTPSLLEPEAIDEILGWIRPSSACEITLEVNPDDVCLEKMQAFQKCGINRVSLGVQTLDDKLLKTLSRTHTAKHSLMAIETCVQANIHNLSIDLMYELPGQTLQSWQNTLAEACKLNVTHLSLYNLTIEPHTVFYKKRETLKLPSPQMSLKMLELAVHTFQNAGFSRYEISAFARQGKISTHNTGYWTKRPFLGFGPSAFSYWHGSRFRNLANLNRYANALEKGHDPADFKETLSSKEQLKESLAIGLRCLNGVALNNLTIELENGLLNLQAKGLLEVIGNQVHLTQKGLLFHDTVAEEIMSL